MNVNELLDTIEDALEEGANVPLSGGKKIVDVEQIRDLLDEIRANLPGELRQAQQIVNDRAQIVDTANAQAQAIVKKAGIKCKDDDLMHNELPDPETDRIARMESEICLLRAQLAELQKLLKDRE